MSNPRKSIAIYQNLPSGGAINTYQSTLRFLQKRYQVTKIDEPRYIPKNIIQYLYTSLYISPKNQRIAASKSKHDLLVAYQSWLVKTPSILRYTDKPKIYICHEAMREFYDTEHIKNQSKKEKFINIIRTPIKFIDRKNIKTDRLIVVANSLYSKKIIDKAYDVNSVVIYPGIDTNKYKVSPGQVKENQVVSIGAINKLKNQEFLVDVLAKIEKGIRPTLVLVGNGRDEKYIEMIKVKAKTMGVNLKIKMNISEEEKIAELHKSKVFMYSPIGEPFGLAVEEAISSGLPILTYLRGGGYVEIMDRNNGIMLDKLNSTEWAFSLNQLLSNNLVSKYQHFNTRYAKKNLDERIMNEKIKKLIDKLI